MSERVRECLEFAGDVALVVAFSMALYLIGGSDLLWALADQGATP